MLRRLIIKEFALIDYLELNFSPGFNVLSGETGAGKSIIIGAIGRILGERAVTDQIRDGAVTAIIEAFFETDSVDLTDSIAPLLQKAGIDLPKDGDPLIVTREMYSDGRSSIGRVNGRTVPVAFLRDLGAGLIDIHGQHQHQSLLRSEKHLQLLDSFGSEKIYPLLGDLKKMMGTRDKIRSTLNGIGCDLRERERRLDLLKFQIDEIESASLAEEEEEDLLRKQKVLINAEKIRTAVNAAYLKLNGGDIPGDFSLRDLAGQVSHEIRQAHVYDSSLESVAELMEGASAHLEEVSMELRNYLDTTGFDPRELETAEDRLEVIRNLKRKYGETVADVKKFAVSCREEYEMLQRSEEEALRMEKEIKEIEEKIKKVCGRLTVLRKEAANILEENLQRVFPDLSLEKAMLKIKFAEGEVSLKGVDRVEFLFSANPGEALKPLVNIISGGEVARVMLALKSVFAGQDTVATLIFDEADSGIGGKAVLAVAEKMSLLSKLHQVMVVTHSPQIAAMADKHFFLSKEVKDKRTVTGACELKGDERITELARMLDGSDEPVNLKHAAALMARAERYKKMK